MTNAQGLGALILAAGKGTRMHSARPKVLHTLLGEPMLGHVVAALEPVFGQQVWAVIGHGADDVRAAFRDQPLTFVEQTQQLGTGHALMVSMDVLREAGVRRVLVVNGDMPLLSVAMVRRFLEEAGDAAVAIATLQLPAAGAYGRIVRKERRVTGIVEAKDYDPARHGAETGEINVGLYLLDMEMAARFLPRLSNVNKNGEYYITDLVGMAVAEGLSVVGVCCGDDPAFLGANTPRELVASEERLRARIVDDLLDAGVVVHHPALVTVGPLARVEPGAELHGPCEILGRSVIAADASVGPHCQLRDTIIESGTVVQAFCHLQSAHVGPACTVGPYARLRPGAVMEARAHVGNFVEMKKARLGEGAKANHLTYLGDAEVGAGANVGAGTITCNYDGVHKFRTVIGEKAFIGSNSSLVAPVTIGAGALIGAGSVITKDVPDGMLSLGRGRQVNKERKQ